METERDTNPNDFFVAGGTLRASAPSYVLRPADEELFQMASEGAFCYVLTPRQMGKSSLMIRTAKRLGEQGVRAGIVDLTQIGAKVTVEQWYLGLLSQLRRSLKLETDYAEWWAAHSALGVVQRFTDFLREVVLTEISERVVIFIDEIDSTLQLDFRDDFFAAIRAMYNARAETADFGRLSFVLLGVASPPDLIRDLTRTPFNIGQAIALKEFSRADAAVLQEELEVQFPGKGEAIFERVYGWTNGHPYLTQKLCLTIAEQPQAVWGDAEVDALVGQMFLTEEARKESNLQYVQNNILSHPLKAAMLKLYGQVIKGQAISEDGQSLSENYLKLIGLVKSENGRLHVRNPIYAFAFNTVWVKANNPMPVAQRIAIAGITLTVLMAVVFFVPLLLDWPVPWNSSQVRIQTLKTAFAATESADGKISILSQLMALDAGSDAQKLFLEQPESDQIRFFDEVNPVPGKPEQLDTFTDFIFSKVGAHTKIAIMARRFLLPGEQEAAGRLLNNLSTANRLQLIRSLDGEIVGNKLIAMLSIPDRFTSSEFKFTIFAKLLGTSSTLSQTKDIFLNVLTPEEQVTLYQKVESGIVSQEIFSVTKIIYRELSNNEINNRLLEIMHQKIVDGKQDKLFAEAINAWLSGRRAFLDGDLLASRIAFDTVIAYDAKNASAHVDRAITLAALKEYTTTLRDLNTVLDLDISRANEISRIINSDRGLAQVWRASKNNFPQLRRLTYQGYFLGYVITQSSDELPVEIVVKVFTDTSHACEEIFTLRYGESANTLQTSCGLGVNTFELVGNTPDDRSDNSQQRILEEIVDFNITERASVPTRTPTPTLLFTVNNTVTNSIRGTASTLTTSVNGEKIATATATMTPVLNSNEIGDDLGKAFDQINGFGMVVSSDGNLGSILKYRHVFILNNVIITKSSVLEGSTQGNKQVVLPSVELSDETLHRLLGITGSSGLATPLTIELLSRKGTILYQQKGVIDPNLGLGFDLGFLKVGKSISLEGGSIRIVADQPIIAGLASCTSEYCVAYTNAQYQTKQWFVPGIAKPNLDNPRSNGAYSVLTIMNTSDSEETEILLESAESNFKKTFALSKLGSIEINSKDLEKLPELFSVKITSSKTDIVVVAKYVNSSRKQGEIYTGITAETSGKIHLFPDITWFPQRNDKTLIYIQNVTTETMSATLTLFDRVRSPNAPPVKQEVFPTQTVPPLGTLVFDVSELLISRNISSWEGSAIVQTTQNAGGVAQIMSNGKEQWAILYSAESIP